jgi:hypothetical protein
MDDRKPSSPIHQAGRQSPNGGVAGGRFRTRLPVAFRRATMKQPRPNEPGGECSVGQTRLTREYFKDVSAVLQPRQPRRSLRYPAGRGTRSNPWPIPHSLAHRLPARQDRENLANGVRRLAKVLGRVGTPGKILKIRRLGHATQPRQPRRSLNRRPAAASRFGLAHKSRRPCVHEERGGFRF